MLVRNKLELVENVYKDGSVSSYYYVLNNCHLIFKFIYHIRGPLHGWGHLTWLVIRANQGWPVRGRNHRRLAAGAH